MSRTKIKVLVDNEAMTIDDAAEFLELTKHQIRGNLNRNEGSFKYKGFTIKRITPLYHRNGTKIVCAATHKEWPSILAFSNEFNLKPSQVEAIIRAEQKIEVNGNIYFAPNYKVAHKRFTGRVKRIAIDDKLKKNTQSIEVPKQPQLQLPLQDKTEVVEMSAEVKAIKALRELAIDKIKKAAYDKVAIIIQALELVEKEVNND